MDDLVRDFLVESGENLDRLDQELVQLESDPSSRDLLSSIFRTIHTIKGKLRLSRFCQTGKSRTRRREPAFALARWQAFAECGDHQRTAGYGRCRAADAGRDQND